MVYTTVLAVSAGLEPQRGEMQAELTNDPKRGVTYNRHKDVTKVTSLRTDTTLDLSQKAEKVQRTHAVLVGWQRKETRWMVLGRVTQQKVENPGFDPGASSLRTTHSTD